MVDPLIDRLVAHVPTWGVREISAKRRAAHDDALVKAKEQMTAIDEAKHARTASMRQAAV